MTTRRPEAAPLPPGTLVTYQGTLRYYRDDTLTVLGPCDCRRCPCTEPDCHPHGQPHYELADEHGQVMAHARHSNLRPLSHGAQR